MKASCMLHNLEVAPVIHRRQHGDRKKVDWQQLSHHGCFCGFCSLSGSFSTSKTLFVCRTHLCSSCLKVKKQWQIFFFSSFHPPMTSCRRTCLKVKIEMEEEIMLSQREILTTRHSRGLFVMGLVAAPSLSLSHSHTFPFINTAHNSKWG